jgi:hypothetical protein
VDYPGQQPEAAGNGKWKPDADSVRNRIFHFRESEDLPKDEGRREHRAAAGGRRRTRGAHNAKSRRLNR